MKPTVKLKQTGGGSQKVREQLREVERLRVYVGIPSSDSRAAGLTALLAKAKPSAVKSLTNATSDISNAQLIFIFSKGSPARGIPARPVLEPAIEAKDNRELIAKALSRASAAILTEHPEEAREWLEKAGQLAVNAAKRWFTDPRNRWAPNAPSTIKAKGSARPGIDTSAMRNAITYVLLPE